MRISVAIVAVCCLGTAAAAWANPPARRTADDYVKALQAPAACEHGLPRDADGVCPTVDDATRGFNLLGTSAASKTQPSAANRHASPGHATLRTANRTGVLDDLQITFKLGSAEISPEGKAEATVFAKALEMPALASRRVEIGGHTDARGSADRNLALSQARADAVRDFLVAQGVDTSRLVSKGFGSEDLAVPGQPLNAANRRVAARRLD
jgi:outer membrane protein OmpA-like peptidoglycan-associated protein